MSPIASTTPARDAPIPHGSTARRLEWPLLPPSVRATVERRIGSPVVCADSVGSGYTPGFASVLTCEDGSRHLVKAASKKAQRPFADAYREEARTLSALPGGLPVPRLAWSHEDDLWVVLGMEHVDGRSPMRPWRPAELEPCLDALEVLADRLAPPPIALRTFADDFGPYLQGWEHVRRVAPDLPHLEEAALLATGFRDATEGRALVHTDVRDDRLLLTERGALLTGWSFPLLGAPWVDTVSLLVSVHGDGLDADEVLARRALTRHVPAEDIDSLLALMAGYFFERRDQPTPNSSPYLRVHQSWYAEATWSWLSARRGWA